MPNLLQGGRGRPLHPMLVHFPIALYPTSLVFDALSHLSDDGNPFVVGAFSLIVIALVVSVLAMAAGFADFLPLVYRHGRRVELELVASEELPPASPAEAPPPEAPPPPDPGPDRPAPAG